MDLGEGDVCLTGCKLHLILSLGSHSVGFRIVYVTKLIMFQNLKVNCIFLLCWFLLGIKEF